MRLKLTVAAPMRVGGREQRMNKLEYVQRGGRLHTINPRKLAKLLLSKGERTLDDWNIEVLRKGQNADLTSFLSREGLLTTDALENVTRFSVPCEHQRMNEFQPQARDGFGKLFIPGSAIKGAIRSAVMYALVDEGRANEFVSRTNERKDRFARELDRRTLQSYELPNRDLKAGPHFDLLRAVKVADAYGELNSRVEKITIQSYTEDGRGRTASLGASNTIYVECLVPGSWVEFDLKVDEKILKDFQSGNEGIQFENEAELLGLVRDFYGEVWSRERIYYGVQESGSEEPEPAEEPEKFPELEEWIEREKGIPRGTLGKNKQKFHRPEYNTARRDFEAGHGAQEQPSKANPGIRDGDVMVGKIKAFYSDDCPGFRLGWGSGLMSTTVDLHLSKENIGKVLNVISNEHHPGAEPIEGPKSRKLVERDGASRWPMGWARLEVL